MEKPYSLEIYEPGSADDVAGYVESDLPFGSIQRGDLISIMFTAAEPQEDVLAVVGIEHILWSADGRAKHKICVFTERRQNNRESRLRGRASQAPSRPQGR